MPSKDELITLADAITEYQRSRAWWYQRISAGELTAYEIPGDRFTYLSRAEIERLLEPRPKPNDGASAADGTR